MKELNWREGKKREFERQMKKGREGERKIEGDREIKEEKGDGRFKWERGKEREAER
jgi:hypothetical protein